MVSLLPTIPTCQARCAYWCNSGAVVIGVTIYFGVGFEALITENSSCLIL